MQAMTHWRSFMVCVEQGFYGVPDEVRVIYVFAGGLSATAASAVSSRKVNVS